MAAGGVITGIDDADESCFALIRPPGHHATRNQAMGFCIFNNIAIGAAYGQKHGYERIAILDFDLHHGNGTQDIFYSDELLYISLHQWPHYPGSGWLDEIGEGSGRGYTINIPLPPGTGDNTYAKSLEEIVYPVLSEYSPSLLLVSAGYDGHYDDPLGNLMLSTKTYRNIAKETKRLGEKVVFSLEGGYNLSYLPPCIYASLKGLFDLQDDDPDKEQKEEKWVVEKVDERLKYLKKLLKDYWSL